MINNKIKKIRRKLDILDDRMLIIVKSLLVDKYCQIKLKKSNYR